MLITPDWYLVITWTDPISLWPSKNPSASIAQYKVVEMGHTLNEAVLTALNYVKLHL